MKRFALLVPLLVVWAAMGGAAQGKQPWLSVPAARHALRISLHEDRIEGFELRSAIRTCQRHGRGNVHCRVHIVGPMLHQNESLGINQDPPVRAYALTIRVTWTAKCRAVVSSVNLPRTCRGWVLREWSTKAEDEQQQQQFDQGIGPDFPPDPPNRWVCLTGTCSPPKP